MKTVKTLFKKEQIKYPNKSSILCFADVIAGQHLNKRQVTEAFNKLVETADYCKEDKKFIIQTLVQISRQNNPPKYVKNVFHYDFRGLLEIQDESPVVEIQVKQ